MKPMPLSKCPEMNFDRTAPGGQPLMNGLVIFLAVCAILYFGRDILIPVMLSVLLAVLLAPGIRLLQQAGLPKTPAVLFAVVLTFAALFAVTVLVASTVANLASDLPQYESNLREKAKALKAVTTGGGTLERAADVLKDLQGELQPHQEGRTPPSSSPRPIPVEIMDTVLGPFDPIISIVGLLIHPITQLGIVILMLTFVLLYREDLRNRLIRLAGTGDINRTTMALDEAGARLSRMFLAQLLVNAGVGVFVGAALFFIGVPGALLWGVLTMVLRFVPYVGSLLASVFPVLIATAVGDGWTMAALTALVVFGSDAVTNMAIEPAVFGRSTGLSAVAIVAAAAFWAAIWGPIGLILSTPITIGLLVLGRHIDALGFLEVLFGSEPVLTPDHAFYQRLLAGDPVEAAEQAAGYAREDRLEGFLCEVAVPALMLAHHDHRRGILDAGRETLIAKTFSDMLDEMWDADSEEDESAAVLLLSAHGALNFAATLAFSAFLTLRNIPHRMLPQDAVRPGRFPPVDAGRISHACLCYVMAPGQAQADYVLRRIRAKLQGAMVVTVAWSGAENSAGSHTPANATALLPRPASDSVSVPGVQNREPLAPSSVVRAEDTT